MRTSLAAAFAVAVVLLAGTAAAEPPFRDLPWTWPEVLTSDDPSALREVTYEGKGKRLFWKQWRWQTMNVHLFRARYRGGVTIEVQVSPEWRRLARTRCTERVGRRLAAVREPGIPG